MAQLDTFIKLKKIPDYVNAILNYVTVSNHPILQKIPLSLKMSVLNRIALSRADRFCYFRIPKVANSTIVTSLLESSDNFVTTGIDAVTAKRILHGIPTLSDLEKSFVFTFVRHPATRTLSAYLEKSRDENFRRKHTCLQGSIGTANGFASFLDQLADGQLFDNIHWAPQTSVLPWHIDRYDFIGKFENLNGDLSACLDHIFPGRSVMARHNPHRTGADDKLKDFVGKRQTQLIEKLYSEDFERFYPNSPPQNPSGMSL